MNARARGGEMDGGGALFRGVWRDTSRLSSEPGQGARLLPPGRYRVSQII